MATSKPDVAMSRSDRWTRRTEYPLTALAVLFVGACVADIATHVVAPAPSVVHRARRTSDSAAVTRIYVAAEGAVRGARLFGAAYMPRFVWLIWSGLMARWGDEDRRAGASGKPPAGRRRLT